MSSMNHIQEGDLARGLRYGCSTRIDGTMLVATNNELFLLGQQNREKFFQQSNINHWAVCRLAHGADIRVVTMSDDKTVAYGCDGLVTATLNLFLCLTVADCFPVYFWSKNKKAKPRNPPPPGAPRAFFFPPPPPPLPFFILAPKINWKPISHSQTQK